MEFNLFSAENFKLYNRTFPEDSLYQVSYSFVDKVKLWTELKIRLLYWCMREDFRNIGSTVDLLHCTKQCWHNIQWKHVASQSISHHSHDDMWSRKVHLNTKKKKKFVYNTVSQEQLVALACSLSNNNLLGIFQISTKNYK